MQFINPPGAPKPSSSYSQGVLVSANARRLVISGQVGVAPDGTMRQGMRAQTEQVFANMRAVLNAAGMDVGDIVKIVTYCTRPDEIPVVREVRAGFFGSHTPASTFLMVPALANPDYLIEIEAEAVKED
jgi:enamine deaminase RidA (YjgF/YER057c/UK114 family)